MRAISEGKVNLKPSISEEGLNSIYRPPLGVYCYLQKLVIQERKNFDLSDFHRILVLGSTLI